MVGFRNIAVHDYQALKLDILEAILEKHINDLKSLQSWFYNWKCR